MTENIFLPTYIINLKRRPKRLEHIKKQFYGRDEFKLNIVEAVEDRIGAVGLWKSIVKIVNLAIENDESVIVICEDDHQFTNAYNKEFLLSNVIDAHKQGADILCGGISGGYEYVVPITENRFWVDGYWCNQFIILYKKFFHQIINTEFDETSKVDHTLSKLTINKMVLYPFISTQHFFGYSDVTKYNEDDPDWAVNRFDMASEKLKVIHSLYKFYQNK